ncbi:MAG: hypothetical protein B7Y39_06230 [Bdellovibrio sp. 28-41-41]|nr:MAG: hypothetical protein B7Y39_06230 [Bdellovibrio sp. 28-41-41]
MLKLMSIVFTIACYLLPAQALSATDGGKVVRFFSDVDDTIKISYVHNLAEGAAFSSYADQLFFGMNTTYSEARKYQQKLGNKVSFSYVTNGIDFTINDTHRALLKNFRFPNPGNHFPMTLIDKLKHREHKFETIMTAVRNDLPDRVVLIGDNGEHDPAIYLKVANAIKKLSAEIDKEIEVVTYIHIVYKPKSPNTQSVRQHQKGFHNAGDLAILMHNDGLISEEQRDTMVRIVKARIQKEGPYRVWGQLVYPWFKYKDLGHLAPNSCLSFYKSK